MHPTNTHSTAGSRADAPASTREEAFAGALALMTEHARAPGEVQAALAQSVSMYLMAIAGAACPSADCRLALLVLASHWASMAQVRSFRRDDIVLWHVSPATIQ